MRNICVWFGQIVLISAMDIMNGEQCVICEDDVQGGVKYLSQPCMHAVCEDCYKIKDKVFEKNMITCGGCNERVMSVKLYEEDIFWEYESSQDAFVVPSAVASTRWACVTCAHSNHAGLISCEQCGARRPCIVVDGPNAARFYWNSLNVPNPEKSQYWEGMMEVVRYYREADPDRFVQVVVPWSYRYHPSYQYETAFPDDLKHANVLKVAAQSPLGVDEDGMDDLLALQLAFDYKCQFATNDNYKDWLAKFSDGPFKNEDIHNWLKDDTSHLRVKLAFDAGRFIPIGGSGETAQKPTVSSPMMSGTAVLPVPRAPSPAKATREASRSPEQFSPPAPRAPSPENPRSLTINTTIENSAEGVSPPIEEFSPMELRDKEIKELAAAQKEAEKQRPAVEIKKQSPKKSESPKKSPNLLRCVVCNKKRSEVQSAMDMCNHCTRKEEVRKAGSKKAAEDARAREQQKHNRAKAHERSERQKMQIAVVNERCEKRWWSTIARFVSKPSREELRVMSSRWKSEIFHYSHVFRDICNSQKKGALNDFQANFLEDRDRWEASQRLKLYMQIQQARLRQAHAAQERERTEVSAREKSKKEAPKRARGEASARETAEQLRERGAAIAREKEAKQRRQRHAQEVKRREAEARDFERRTKERASAAAKFRTADLRQRSRKSKEDVLQQYVTLVDNFFDEICPPAAQKFFKKVYNVDKFESLSEEEQNLVPKYITDFVARAKSKQWFVQFPEVVMDLAAHELLDEGAERRKSLSAALSWPKAMADVMASFRRHKINSPDDPRAERVALHAKHPVCFEIEALIEGLENHPALVQHNFNRFRGPHSGDRDSKYLEKDMLYQNFWDIEVLNVLDHSVEYMLPVSPGTKSNMCEELLRTWRKTTVLDDILVMMRSDGPHWNDRVTMFFWSFQNALTSVIEDFPRSANITAKDLIDDIFRFNEVLISCLMSGLGFKLPDSLNTDTLLPRIFNSMSGSHLKQFIQSHGANCEGIIEKNELIRMASSVLQKIQYDKITDLHERGLFAMPIKQWCDHAVQVIEACVPGVREELGGNVDFLGNYHYRQYFENWRLRAGFEDDYRSDGGKPTCAGCGVPSQYACAGCGMFHLCSTKCETAWRARSSDHNWCAPLAAFADTMDEYYRTQIGPLPKDY